MEQSLSFVLRRLFGVLAAGVLLLFFTACGGGTTGSTGQIFAARPSGGGTPTATRTPAATAASSAGTGGDHRPSRTTVLTPEASGDVVMGSKRVTIDASHTADGYVMVRYTGSAKMAKVMISQPDGDITCTYSISGQDYVVFPLAGGDGNYHVDVLEDAYDGKYALVYSTDLSVTISDAFSPFLYPNQYVWFTKDDDAVALALDLSDRSRNDLDYVGQVYSYVTGNITYDTALAAVVQPGYVPDIDATLASGKGICFDYASLMAAMLRSQGIPTKLVFGYSGTAYHAWISVYLSEVGWVNNIISFDGKSWKLMDPTLAAKNDPAAVQKYTGDGSNYSPRYYY